MAALSPFSVALWALVPALAVPVIAAMRGAVASRIVALQLATALASLLLVLMSFVFDQDSYTTLAVALSLMGAVGTFVVAITVERWL